MLDADGKQGGGLTRTFKNFSFANQRFESEGVPRLRFACTIRASMLFLTSEVDDANRKNEEKGKARAILSVFNPEDLVLFGLESDLAGHGTELIRFFDVHAPDPSLLPRRLRRFRQEVGKLFMEGTILHESNEASVTGIIIATLSGPKATFFWGEDVRTMGAWVGNHAAVRQALQRVQTAARLLLETLAAEFDDRLFPQAWEIFDLGSWLGVAADSPTDKRLMDKFSTICRARGWNEVAAAREFRHVRSVALAKYGGYPKSDRDTDGAEAEPRGDSARGSTEVVWRRLNRQCWADALDLAERLHGRLPAFRTPPPNQHPRRTCACACVLRV